MDPLDVDSLRAAHAAGCRFTYRPFWRIGDDPDPIFSQWYPSPFIVDGETFQTAEHYMMAGKARLMGDEAARARILAAPHPRDVKALGRTVRNYDEARWCEHRFDIVTRGSLGKFSTEPFRACLLETADAVLVEASPVDTIWGIGLAPDDPSIAEPSRWRGLNLLGFALMRARAALRQTSSR
jgi:ribA/ribD-fused uncharacterized protein